MSEPAADRDVMGHNERERRRLALQASILRPGDSAPSRSSIFRSGLRHIRMLNGFFTAEIHANFGSGFFHLFTDAGFEHTDCRGEFPVDGDPSSPRHEWLAEATRGILSSARSMNISGATKWTSTRWSSGCSTNPAQKQVAGSVIFSCFARGREGA